MQRVYAIQPQPNKTFFQFSRLTIARSTAPRQFECWDEHQDSFLTPLSDDHSRVEPPLPIPNRTVKRSRANDSRHCACESRSSSDSLSVSRQSPGYPKPPQNPRGFFIGKKKMGLPVVHEEPFPRFLVLPFQTGNLIIHFKYNQLCCAYNFSCIAFAFQTL